MRTTHRYRQFFKCRQGNAGFTLIELIFVLAILLIMVGALFGNQAAGQSALASQRSSQLVVEALREAENNALGAKAVGTSSSPGGWGVHFQAGRNPILFAGINCNPPTTPCDYTYDQGVAVRTIVLDPHTSITALSPGSGTLDVVFVSPNPTIYVNGIMSSPLTADATITITATYGSVTVKTIRVNTVGLISVQ